MGKKTLITPKGASPPFPKTPFSLLFKEGLRENSIRGEHTKIHPPIRQSLSSLGQNPKSQLIILFTARGAAYLISRIVP
jgi:hypothetical protein